MERSFDPNYTFEKVRKTKTAGREATVVQCWYAFLQGWQHQYSHSLLISCGGCITQNELLYPKFLSVHGSHCVDLEEGNNMNIFKSICSATATVVDYERIFLSRIQYCFVTYNQHNMTS